MSIEIQSGQSQRPLATGPGKRLHRGLAPRTLSGMRASVGSIRQLGMTITTATDAFLYQIRGRLPGGDWTTVEFLTVATTASLLRDGLIAAWNADAALSGQALASAAVSGTQILFTGYSSTGAAFEVEEVADSNAALAAVTVVTAAAANAVQPFGTYMDVNARSSAGGIDRLGVAELTAAAGPVVTLTATYVSAKTATYSITMNNPNGQTFVFATAAIAVGANLAAMTAAIKAALDIDLAGTGATVVVDGADIAINFAIGWSYVIAFTSATDTADLTNVNAAGSAAPSQTAIVIDTGDVPELTIGTASTGWPSNTSIPLLESGDGISVTNPGDSPAYGGTVWVETAAGATKGYPYSVASPTRFAHPTHVWEQVDPTSSSIAIIGA